MSGAPAGALPPRDPEALLPRPLTRALTFLVVGMMGAALGAVLMAADSGVEGHGHGGGGNPFVMLPHQILLALPLSLALVLLLREADARRTALALGASVGGIVLVDLLLWV